MLVVCKAQSDAKKAQSWESLFRYLTHKPQEEDNFGLMLSTHDNNTFTTNFKFMDTYMCLIYQQMHHFLKYSC